MLLSLFTMLKMTHYYAMNQGCLSVAAIVGAWIAALPWLRYA
jgi:hypothetical protein